MRRLPSGTWTGATAALFLLFVAVDVSAQSTDPGEVPGRLSHFEGTVTVQRAAAGETEAALVNLPVGSGDRIWTDADGRVEISFEDGTSVWLDGRTTLDFLSLPRTAGNDGFLLRLWAGSLYVERPFDRRDLRPLRIDAPAGSVGIDDGGLVRVDLDGDEAVWLSVYDGIAALSAGGLTETLGAGQRSFAEAGTAPARAESFNTVDSDDFDSWRGERVALYADTRQYARGRDYVPRTIVHYASDLERNGSWAYHNDYKSWYWRPQVAVSWTPYRHGRWVYTYGGWSWVPWERWGYVTSHYGRWHYGASFGWVWFPGSVWTPASVHWYIGRGHVGWVPLNFYGRPAVTFKAHIGGGRFGSGFGNRDRRSRGVGPIGSASGRGRVVNGAGYSSGLADAWTIVDANEFSGADVGRKAVSRTALPRDLDQGSKALVSGPLRARSPAALVGDGNVGRRQAVARGRDRAATGDGTGAAISGERTPRSAAGNARSARVRANPATTSPARGDTSGGSVDRTPTTRGRATRPADAGSPSQDQVGPRRATTRGAAIAPRAQASGRSAPGVSAPARATTRTAPRATSPTRRTAPTPGRATSPARRSAPRAQANRSSGPSARPAVRTPARSTGSGSSRPAVRAPARPSGSGASRPAVRAPARRSGGSSSRPAVRAPARPSGSGASRPAVRAPARRSGGISSRPAVRAPARPSGSGASRPAVRAPARRSGGISSRPAVRAPARPSGSGASRAAVRAPARSSGSSSSRPSSATPARAARGKAKPKK